MTMVILRSEKPADRALRERRGAVIQAIEWQVRIRPNVWAPPADLFETETDYIVRVEVAGMRDQEIGHARRRPAISGRRGYTPERAVRWKSVWEFQSGLSYPGGERRCRLGCRRWFPVITLQSQPTPITLRSHPCLHPAGTQYWNSLTGSERKILS
jgi:hypothetical protein